jgi:pimeloyl-ACP methyl ester carboxylesterase
MTEISRNGRTVAVHDLTPDAPADAPVVLMCHAAPGSGSFDPDPEATAAAGIRLIEVDRPGYGGSDPVKDDFATIGLAADDAAAVLADVLPAGGRAGVAGWSAGGRVALALAARHPELVGRVAVIAAPAPDEEVPWYGDENRAMVDALRGLPPADAVAQLTAVFEGMLAGAGGDALLGLAGVADADADVLTAPVRERLRAMLDAATVQGVTGDGGGPRRLHARRLGLHAVAGRGGRAARLRRRRRSGPTRARRVVPRSTPVGAVGDPGGRRTPRRRPRLEPGARVPGEVRESLVNSADAESNACPKGEGGAVGATSMQQRPP